MSDKTFLGLGNPVFDGGPLSAGSSTPVFSVLGPRQAVGATPEQAVGITGNSPVNSDWASAMQRRGRLGGRGPGESGF